jgi:hypothetical protein
MDVEVDTGNGRWGSDQIPNIYDKKYQERKSINVNKCLNSLNIFFLLKLKYINILNSLLLSENAFY